MSGMMQCWLGGAHKKASPPAGEAGVKQGIFRWAHPSYVPVAFAPPEAAPEARVPPPEDLPPLALPADLPLFALPPAPAFPCGVALGTIEGRPVGLPAWAAPVAVGADAAAPPACPAACGAAMRGPDGVNTVVGSAAAGVSVSLPKPPPEGSRLGSIVGGVIVPGGTATPAFGAIRPVPDWLI
jgi:hypothetical protein